MRRFVSNHKEFHLLVAPVVLIFGWWPWAHTACLRGQLAAHYDVARGHQLQLIYGLPSLMDPVYARVLRERYGIEMRTVAGCIISTSLRSYADGYNEVSVAAANRKWGRDVFEDSWKEAARIWAQTHQDAPVQ